MGAGRGARNAKTPRGGTVRMQDCANSTILVHFLFFRKKNVTNGQPPPVLTLRIISVFLEI
jgi:hypothetical protein